MVEEKDAAHKAAAKALSKAVFSKKGVDAAKAASAKAKTALELARQTYQQTKARRDSGGGGATSTDRLHGYPTGNITSVALLPLHRTPRVRSLAVPPRLQPHLSPCMPPMSTHSR